MGHAETIPKKRQLVEAAAGLFHEQGVATTTLADIAAAAKVALGSVYYYFKSKDDLVCSVIDQRKDTIARLIARQETISDPRDRLGALVQVWVEDNDIDALYGCPVGSICFELARTRGPLSEQATRPFRLLLDWCEKQFRLLGAGDKSDRYALHIISALQGISLTAAVFGEAEMITKEAEHLQEWLQTI